jgi:copper chaperone CopZ
MKKKLLIEGMSCGHCVKHVKEALLEVKGMKSAEVELSTKSAVIDGEAEDSAIKFAVEDAGYEVVSIEAL